MEQVTNTQKALILETAKSLRSAIDQRSQMMAKHLAEYDDAVEQLDEEKIQVAAIMLIAMCAIGDPVQAALRRYGETADLLKRAEGRV